MGLLGDFEDPKTQGLLALGLGLLNSRGNFGQGLGQAGMGAMQAMQQAQQAQQKKQLQDSQLQAQGQQMQAGALHMQLQQQQLAEAQQKASEQQRMRAFLEGLQSPQQAALAAGGGPTNANAAAIDPMQTMMLQGVRAGAVPLQSYLQSLQKDETPIPVKEGETLVDRRTYQPKFSNPKPVDSPAAIKEYQYSVAQGYKGSFDQWDTARKRAGATNVSLNAGQRFENAYSTDQGKQFSEVMAGINKAGFAAPAQIRKLERMQQLLDGVDGGKLAPTGLDIASAANAIGIKMDPRLGNKEASQALGRELAGGMRQPGTGPMTDKDFDNFLAQVPDLSKRAAGRKQITTTMRAAAARDIEISKLAREYVKKNGQLDNGFLEIASQYVAENPVVGLPQGWKVR